MVERIIAEAEESGRRILCQQGDVAHRVILSDTYIDACENYYRDIKQLEFRQSIENEGTLFSPGRTNYRVQGAAANERYDGDTYPVPHTDFLFLAELLPGNMERIKRGRATARETHRLDEDGRRFLWKG